MFADVVMMIDVADDSDDLSTIIRIRITSIITTFNIIPITTASSPPPLPTSTSSIFSVSSSLPS